MTDTDQFTDTTSQLAREAAVTAQTVVVYADKGWLEHIRLPGTGMRLFRTGQAAKVREIYLERLSLRGRRPAASAGA